MKIYKNPQLNELLNSSILSEKAKHLTADELLNLPELFKEISKQVLSDIGSSATTIVPTDSWINYYGPGITNEMHTHSDPWFLSKGDHVGIQIIKTGETPEEITFILDGQEVDIPVEAGDFIVIDHTIVHGLKPVKNELQAWMIVIKK